MCHKEKFVEIKLFIVMCLLKTYNKAECLLSSSECKFGEHHFEYSLTLLYISCPVYISKRRDVSNVSFNLSETMIFLLEKDLDVDFIICSLTCPCKKGILIPEKKSQIVFHTFHDFICAV